MSPRLFVLPLLLVTMIAIAEPITVMDDLGRKVALSAPAERVVSLAPHLTEILFEIGVGSRILGTVRH
ncbi:MAG: hypothetical protein WD601_09315, partial [Pseudohongiellaceae bacterium]